MTPFRLFGLCAVLLLALNQPSSWAQDEDDEEEADAPPVVNPLVPGMNPMGIPGRGGQPPRGLSPLSEALERQAREAAEGGDAASKRAREAADDNGGAAAGTEIRSRPPQVDDPTETMVSIDFVNKPILELIRYMADVTGRNFILGDDIKGEVTIISEKPVSMAEAYEAFLAALEVTGYTTVSTGSHTRIVSTQNAGTSPIRVYEGSGIPYTANYVTQIFSLDNVSVSDIVNVVKELAGKSAKVIAYNPTNTLIVTDSATNIRRVYRIVSQLDVAAPRSRLEVVQIEHAQAAEIASVIEDIYGSEATPVASDDRSSRRSTRDRPRRSSVRQRGRDDAGGQASATNVGGEGKYIQKIIADERTNALVIMANESAMVAILELIKKLDVDVDPERHAQIHVYYLKHSKSEDVAEVLANLSQGGSSSSSSRSGSASSQRRNTQTSAARGAEAARAALQGRGGDSKGGDAPGGSVVAAFESGLRVTSDETTNSLVIIATPDQFQIIEQVISKLDIPRKQVFVEAVILELASQDTSDLGIAYHIGKPNEDGGLSMGSAQLDNTSLFGPNVEGALTGLALGVFGQAIDVTIPDPLNPGQTTSVGIPGFGIALNALQGSSAVNILSTPNILTMDNQEARIVVGRNVPFPVTQAANNISNIPVVSYQREDVAITLRVTPQINESQFVTMEVFQEVSEVEEGSEDNAAGPTTSKRTAETAVVVKDNQTVVIGGLIGTTDTESETKIPILGDLPLIGRLFRSKTIKSRKTNLLIFLTPHIINGPPDLEEVYRIKMLQRDEYIRRFYGKSRDKQEEEIRSLLQFSMNQIDSPSSWRMKDADDPSYTIIGGENFEVIGELPEVIGGPRSADELLKEISGEDEDVIQLKAPDKPSEDTPAEQPAAEEPAAEEPAERIGPPDDAGGE